MRGLRAAILEAHRNGVTSVQDTIARPDDFLLYDEARRAGDLNVRVYSSINVDEVPEAEAFKQLEALSSKYPDDPIFKMGGGEDRDRWTGGIIRRRPAAAVRRKA